MPMNGNALTMRINGVLPDTGTSGVHTSVSVFSGDYHLLVDCGSGVAESVRSHGRGPDAILLTHARRQHVSDLPSFSAKAYCSAACADRVSNELGVDRSCFVPVVAGQPFEAGPFSITPVAADNAGESPGFEGSLIYVISAAGKKMVAGWDFINLSGADPALFWNPDLAVLGTETYNDHPSTGIISVSQAYDLVRRWNAKDCYIVHYSGEKDREDKSNQWHRGPTGPLSPDDLQKAIDNHLRVFGQEGKFRIRVARQGMTWTPAENVEDEGPVGGKITIEGMEKYVFEIEKMDGGKLVFTVEDSVNRLASEFVNPKKSGEGSLHADGIKGMMMKGPELNLSVSGTTVAVDIARGKKPVFAASIPISERDAKRLAAYIQENFV
jgi:L-ascorbate metabolism protein UlaG (beta-lactamase superfamily)